MVVTNHWVSVRNRPKSEMIPKKTLTVFIRSHDRWGPSDESSRTNNVYLMVTIHDEDNHWIEGFNKQSVFSRTSVVWTSIAMGQSRQRAIGRQQHMPAFLHAICDNLGGKCTAVNAGIKKERSPLHLRKRKMKVVLSVLIVLTMFSVGFCELPNIPP